MSEQPTVAFHTLGCRLNQYETDGLRAQFVERGFRVVSFTDRADVYVVNTCTVTHQADYRARQALRRVIRQAPDATVVATGCYAQTSPEKLLAIEGVDLVLGNAEKGDLVDHVLRARHQDGPSVHVTRRAEITRFDDRLDVFHFENRARATLKIQDGCDQFCSFCIIPWARGRHRSRPLENVRRQGQAILAEGYREIVLTGVHLGAYGSDLTPRSSLLEAVDALLPLPGLDRLRLSSIWPTAVTDALIDRMALQAPRFCRYLHLAVQHGDNTVLGNMRRTYTVEETEAVMEKAMAAIPDLCIGADIMVGFPGETNAQFEAMRKWLEAMPFAYFHVFSYSPREHTRAAAMPGSVPPTVAQERSLVIRRLSERKALAYHRRFLGRTVDVLVEGRNEAGEQTGHTDSYLNVRFPDNEASSGVMRSVRITRVDADGAWGSPLM